MEDYDSRDVARWRTFKAQDFKSGIRCCGAICGGVTLLGWVVLLITIGAIGLGFPFLPTALLNYGWIFHLVNVPMFLISLVVAGTESTALIDLTAVLMIPVTFINGWTLLANWVPWIVGCITEHPITFFIDCGIDAVYSISMLFISIFFFAASVVCLVYSFSLVSYLHGGRRSGARKLE